MLKKLIKKIISLPPYLAKWGVRIKTKPKNFVLLISHSDYNKTDGGTERILLAQQRYYNQQGYNILSISPLFPKKPDNPLPAVYITRYNGKLLSTSFAKPIFIFLNNNIDELKHIEYHHFMNWGAKDLEGFSKIFNRRKIKTKLWLHDLFILSPRFYYAYTGLTNKLTTPYLDKNLKLINSKKLFDHLKWQNYFLPLLNKANDVIVPSEFLKKIILQNIEIDENKIYVNSPGKESHLNPLKNYNHEKKRLAFLGAKALHKGAVIWDKIISHPKIQDLYLLYHIGADKNKVEKNVINIKYSISAEGKDAAIKKLQENEIDIVLLWSIVPESYSFTLHEALNAGCFILTGIDSGNIAYTINNIHPTRGLVFEDEEQLITYLSKNYNKI